MPQIPREMNPKYNSVLDPDCAILCDHLSLQNTHICRATMALELAYETIAPTPALSGVVIGIGSCDPNKLRDSTQHRTASYQIHPPPCHRLV